MKYFPKDDEMKGAKEFQPTRTKNIRAIPNRRKSHSNTEIYAAKYFASDA